MVEELEVIAMQAQRFINRSLAGSEEEFNRDWLGDLPQLVADTDYRVPSVLERACRYLCRQGRDDEAKQLDSLLRQGILQLQLAQEQVKADFQLVHRERASGERVLSAITSPHWPEVYRVQDVFMELAELCESLQGYDVTEYDSEQPRDPFLQSLLDKWNRAPDGISWNDFSFEELGEQQAGGKLKKRLTRYADKTQQPIKKKSPGNRAF
jgi:hypothetical protein